MQFSKATLNPGEEKISFQGRERMAGGGREDCGEEIFFKLRSQNTDIMMRSRPVQLKKVTV